MFKTISQEVMQIETTVEYLFIPNKMAKKKRSENNYYEQERRKIRALIRC